MLDVSDYHIAYFCIVQLIRGLNNPTCISCTQIFERNPLCGINFPCGKAVTNTCMSIYDDNYTLNRTLNITDDYTVSLMMNGSEVEPILPHSFRICNQPNTALWSTILCVFTFFIAVFLRKLRHSKLFGKQVRCAVVPLALETMPMGYCFQFHTVFNSIFSAV